MQLVAPSGSSGAVTEASMPSLGANLTAADLALTPRRSWTRLAANPRLCRRPWTLDKPCLKD